jgi:hypothetical protein
MAGMAVFQSQTEARMQTQIYQEYSASQCHFGSVRGPIQCEGVARGHRRIAEAAVAGSVNPQVNWGQVGQTVLSALPSILSLF